MGPGDLLLPWHAHSTTVLVVHLVWATRRRAPWLEPRLDAVLASLLARQARALDGQLVAVGNADDHVHVLVGYPPRVAVAELAHRLKGATSHALHRARLVPAACAWQVGYWAESVSPRDCDPLVTYVACQRHHHENHTAAEPWETTLVTGTSPPAGRA